METIQIEKNNFVEVCVAPAYCENVKTSTKRVRVVILVSLSERKPLVVKLTAKFYSLYTFRAVERMDARIDARVDERTNRRTDGSLHALVPHGNGGTIKANHTSTILKQEAHGPRFAHLSDITTADMQMLCNIFSNPIITTVGSMRN